MKIIALEAENIKRLTAVRIEPDGNLVQITGKNESGKTSVLDSIWWALEGAKHIQSVPIRRGARKAHILLDLGELIVMRRFRKKKDSPDFTTAITVESSDGARFPSPQKVLDDLFGALTFDPLAFKRMKPTAQLETLKSFVTGVDFDAIEEAHNEDYAKRTQCNRQAKDLRAQAQGFQIPADTPEAAIDENELVDAIEEAHRVNNEREGERHERAREAEAITALRRDADYAASSAAELKGKAAEYEKHAAESSARAASKEKSLEQAEAIPDPIDVTEIRQKLEHARVVNASVESRTRRNELIESARKLEAKAEALSDAMEERQDQKAKAITESEMPIDGIEFAEGHFLMNGVPFDQASDAQQLRTSVQMAMAMNPKLRVIRIRDGSLLDEDALKLLGEIADDQDFQIWIERVDDSGKVGFVLEDGHLRGQEIEQPAEGEALEQAE